MLKGLYYKKVEFKDDPKYTYVVQPISTYKGILVQGFDSETNKNVKMRSTMHLNKITNLRISS